MNTNDILTLARAGFTSQQIAALNSINTATTPAIPATPPAIPATQPAIPTTPPTIPATPPAGDPVMQQILALTQAVQASNILGIQQPKPESAEDILATIINPPIAGDKNKGV